MPDIKPKPGKIGKVSPKAMLDADGENIEFQEPHAGIDASKAVSADTLVEGMADVGETDMMQYRLTQQAILADFGLEALRGRSLEELQQMATKMSAEGTRSYLCKLLRYLPAENALLVCAGVGWKPGIVGHARVGADMDSPAGYALRTGKPVLSNHLGNEKRFRTPTILAQHNVKRAMNVLILANDQSWGVLEVDSPHDGKFDVADIPFLQGFANLLGVAIERQEAEDRLREAIEHQQLLVRESSHRTMNSLSLVASLLQLQARSSSSDDVKLALNEAMSRILTVAQAHDLLWKSDATGVLNLGDLIAKLCLKLQAQMPQIELHCQTDSFVIDAERAIAAGLLVTELVTNAAKHAYGDGKGAVQISCTKDDGRFTLSVADQGKGLPDGLDIHGASDTSLGMRMISALAHQLRGPIIYTTANGARFSVTAGLEANT